MADLLARFKLVDEMSAKLEALAGKGRSMTDQWEQAGDEVSAALDGIGKAASGAVSSADGVAQSLTGAAESTDYWTEKIGNYDKEAMEAIYTTQELVEMGYKTEAALSDAADAVDEAADAAKALDDANDKAADATEKLGNAAGKASDEAEKGAKKGIGAAEQLSSALAAAGITKLVSEFTESLYEASEAAAEFETATMKIATIADTTQVSLSTIKTDLVSLSRETGIAVGELSEATYSALSASVETASAVEFTGTATKLAAGGFTTSATAVDVLTTALNAYGLEASYAENISDMLITTQNLGKTTVDELANSVGKVIPLASAYNVEMDNLSAAYAELTKGGIATAESTTYLKGMLTELGDSGSTVATILQEETGMGFADLMAQGYSLGDVLEELGGSVNGNATAFSNLWSSTEAGIGALALYNSGAEQFNTTLDAMQTSVGATQSAYDTMTDTTAHAQEELSNAANNLQISIGQNINPLMEKLYGLGTNILNGMTEFTQKHPVVTKGIVAIGVGIAAVAVGFAGISAAAGIYNGVMAISTAVTATFGITLSAALWPITAVAAGIAAVVGVALVLADVFGEAADETEGMTATTRAQYYELQDLNDEYERACEQYGETSEEALRLKYQVDDLSASFEVNRQTVEEFTAEVDALCESVHTVTDDFNSALSEINANEVGALALIQKYDDLASKANRTAAEEQALEAVNKKLSASYPDLAERLDAATMSTEDYVEAMRRAAEAEAEEQRQQQAQETYVEALQKRAELTEELAKAQENVNLEQQRMDDMSGWTHFWTGGEWDDLEAYQAALEELEAAQAENEATIAEIEQGWTDLASAEAEAAEAVVGYDEAVETALSSVQGDIDELCAAYDEAYDSARSSIDGQIGLFDTMATETELSVRDMQSALDSQLEYLDTYSENLRKAAEYGLDEGLIASLSDGSEESAGYLNAIIQNIEKLGDGTAEAQEFVDGFNAKFQEVEAAKDEFATTVATMETDFDEKMGEIEERLDEAIGNMNMDEDAAAAAQATMDAYTQAIRDGTANAVSAAEAASNAVSVALGSSYSNSTVTTAATVQADANGTTYADDVFLAGENGPELVARPAAAYATGTTDSSDYFIAGENGPELIIGEQGSTVFPTSETDRLLNALAERQPMMVLAPQESGGGREAAAEQVKRIFLEIAGSGAIEIGGSGGMDEEEVLEFLMKHLKPVLMSIVQGEITEEGDGTYDF